jgi:fermentation-respiration switch protein FrsA (DUF1100 family)
MFMPGVNLLMKIFFGFDMKSVNGEESIRGKKVPVCFIHGIEDTFILPSNSEKLQKAAGGYTEIHMVEGAGHAESREKLGKEAYQEIIAQFLKSAEHQ